MGISNEHTFAQKSQQRSKHQNLPSPILKALYPQHRPDHLPTTTLMLPARRRSARLRRQATMSITRISPTIPLDEKPQQLTQRTDS